MLPATTPSMAHGSISMCVYLGASGAERSAWRMAIMARLVSSTSRYSMAPESTASIHGSLPALRAAAASRSNTSALASSRTTMRGRVKRPPSVHAASSFAMTFQTTDVKTLMTPERLRALSSL